MKRRVKAPTLEDLTFESRNKEYGAYVIFKTASRRLRISFIIALGIFFFLLLVTGGGIRFPWIVSYEMSQDVNIVSVKYDPALITILSEPEKLSPAPRKAREFTPPRIVDQEPEPIVPEESIQAAEKPNPVETGEEAMKDSLARAEAEAQEKAIPKPDHSNDTLLVIEQAPQFPGGPQAMKQFISSSLQYPADAIRRKVTGTVVMNFIVEKDGSIGRVIISKKVDPVIDFEAIRIIESMPHWKPAVRHGQPIACMLVIPITFSLR